MNYLAELAISSLKYPNALLKYIITHGDVEIVSEEDLLEKYFATQLLDITVDNISDYGRIYLSAGKQEASYAPSWWGSFLDNIPSPKGKVIDGASLMIALVWAWEGM